MESLHAKHTALFLCGGRGTRMQGHVDDKILAPLAGKPALAYSLIAFESSKLFNQAIFVFRDDKQKKQIHDLVEKFAPSLFENAIFCQGGTERKDSVLNGLVAGTPAHNAAAERLVFIHDCARPCITANSLIALEETASREGAAVLAHRCKNTIKRVPEKIGTGVACEFEDLDRSRLWEMETPQVFPFNKIFAAYQAVAGNGIVVTDDVAAAAAHGIPVALVENVYPNPKLTHPEDFIFCEALLSKK